MQDLLTPENLPATLTAFAGLVTAIGGAVLWRVRKEPPKAGTADAALTALAENTAAVRAMAAAMQSQNAHFGENNEMFKALGPLISGVAKDITDMKHDGVERRILLASVRDALNRRAR